MAVLSWNVASVLGAVILVLSVKTILAHVVASCQRCNAYKSAKIIYSDEQEEDIRNFLKHRWFNGG